MSPTPTLPVDSVLPELRRALRSSSAAILTAAPGAGKTTRVPLALLGEDWLVGRSIVMLEPRRLAARAAARRMAETLGERFGETVGYTVRLEREVSAKTRIEVVTEGVLTRRLQNDPALDGVGLLIFDEFHERGLDGDLGLALALDIQRGLREDLKLLIMSATLDAERLAAFLGGAPVVAAAGRLYPVETRHLDRATKQTIHADMARAIGTALREAPGSILAFMPGEAEIRRTVAALGDLPSNTVALPLYGAMALGDQDAAIRPPAPGMRKIVLATTIAETSLTIEGIGVVIDGGLKRVPRFDPASAMTALATVRVSQAAADQRRGRAGRTEPGVCYRLWPEAETRALHAQDAPEILQADLAPLALDLAAWGVADPAQLSWLDPPPSAAFAQARDLLKHLDALDHQGAITAMGRAMTRLPLHPRLAHMVLRGKELGAGTLAADLAALLSERDLLNRDAGADIAARVDYLGRGRAPRTAAAARQIRALAKIGADTGDVDPGLLIAFAWPDRIAQARGGLGRFRLANGAGAALPAHDPLASSPYLAVATTDGAAGDQRIHLAASLSRADIERHFAGAIVEQARIAWDTRQEQVMASSRRQLGALVLDDTRQANPDSGAVAQAMAEGVRAMGLDALPWTTAARTLRARVAYLAQLFPEQDWPDLSDAALVAGLDRWLMPYLAGLTRRSHLDRLDLHAILSDLIPPVLRRDLARLAPARIAIPSGAEIAIDYGAEGGPTVAARLQEMFGLAATPTIADGRAKLRLELLSPAGRPLAVTQSLETFWANVYPQVRAEMRGRYPKHAWPADPLAVPPLRPGKVR